MRSVFSYLLVFTLALSGLNGSVQTAHAYTLADALNQHVTSDVADSTPDMPCHSAKNVTVTDTEHDCCDKPQQQCEGDCCAKHCATGGALLAAELFRYIRPDNTIARHSISLPLWLFAAEPPPPIIA